MSIDDVLRACGVVLRDGETVLVGLRRHAAAHGWRKPICQKWENECVPFIADSEFDSLLQLNYWLQGLKLPTASTKKEAHKLLQGVFINIYDLVAERFHRKKPSLEALRAYTHQYKLFYPLKDAKNEGLRALLRTIL